MDPRAFLLTDKNIQCLPSKRNARLYLTGENPLRRWHESALFPAFRPTAKMYRFLLRIKATVGWGSGFYNINHFCPVREFLEDVLPKVSSVVLLIGAAGPTQKITLQLWDKQQIVGYLKYGEKPTAQDRIKQEAEVLKALPSAHGPTLLKFDSLGDGLAVVLSPVVGEALDVRLSLAKDLTSFVLKLAHSDPVPLENHPWIKKMQKYTSVPSFCLTPLANRKWPIVFQHGDLAPWNIYRKSNGSLKAIDWEYGLVAGFPFLDLAFFLLQVARLIHHWSPMRAKIHAINVLSGTHSLNLTLEQAQGIVCLCAYQKCKQIELDGTGNIAWWESCVEEKL